MRRFATAFLLGSLAAQDPPPADYVVHEWGTFTSMAGSQGCWLDGLQREEEALPPFVHDLLRIEAWRRDTGEKLAASGVTQKMETPVIYFYSEQARQVDVSVWFRQGLMTQFYPLPTTITPELDRARTQRIDMAKVDGSALRWQVDVLPRGAAVAPMVPTVAAHEPWALARQTSANLLRTRPQAGSPAHPESEHYLFYRGLGRWQPDVGVAVERGGNVTLQNRMAQPIPFCLCLELDERGGRFAVGKALPAGGEQRWHLGREPWHPDRAAVARRVGGAVLQALVGSGLYDDEARAMVATWSRSWFEKPGARVFYLLPRQQVDTVLPLHLSPPPKELVRTLVARLEFITPEAQERVEHALLAHTRPESPDHATAAAALQDLDRFLEPHLRQIAASGSSAAARAAAASMLATQAPPLR